MAATHTCTYSSIAILQHGRSALFVFQQTALRLSGTMSAAAGASPPPGTVAPGPRSTLSSSSSSSSTDLVNALRGYVDRILGAVPGMKALVLDTETCQAVSLVYSQHELLSKDVFLTDFLHKQATRATQQPKPFLKAVVLARPTDENMLLLKAELRQPSFGAYHVTWTSTLPDDRLRTLAEYDIKDRVATVHEAYIDFFALDSVCFSAGVSPEISATVNIPQVNWSGQETAGFARCTDCAYCDADRFLTHQGCGCGCVFDFSFCLRQRPADAATHAKRNLDEACLSCVGTRPTTPCAPTPGERTAVTSFLPNPSLQPHPQMRPPHPRPFPHATPTTQVFWRCCWR